MTKVRGEIKEFIDGQIKGDRPLNYRRLKQAVARRFGVRISKATISKRVRALKVQVRRGRKRIVPSGKRPAHSIFLDCAGAFFLKGAELETGLLATVNQLLGTSSKSAQARKALNLARQINAILLYAPIFRLKTVQDVVDYDQKGLLSLSGQEGIPQQEEIVQYLQYLSAHKLLPFIIKEVAKICPEALLVRIDFAGQTFYLDAQLRTVWANTKVPRFLSATLSKTKSCVKEVFQSPSPRYPLILQASPGYTFLPAEMFNLIQCLEKAHEESISRITIADRFGATLSVWEDVKPRQKCFFIAPLNPWQYAKLEHTQIVRDFRKYFIGPEKEPMVIADAKANLFNPQLSKNIRVRAALVRRKEERLALITNISSHEERYIRKIVEQYFCHWPEQKLKTYYDLLEEVHEEALLRTYEQSYITPLPTLAYKQKPENVFALFLEHLNHYTRTHFFPAEYAGESLKSMQEKFYGQGGFLRKKQDCWEVYLRPPGQKTLQKDLQIACQRFNQSDPRFPSQKRLRIYQC